MSASLRMNYAECPAAPELFRANVPLNGRSAFFLVNADIRGAEEVSKKNNDDTDDDTEMPLGLCVVPM